eukprot:GHVP01010471.1.p1 GENE.GHVP01010471.1~~GHVP01010471.1.p1  ORF type:complete len:372 (-),score=61.71 GHVP01010471.1:581-1696(-)
MEIQGFGFEEKLDIICSKLAAPLLELVDLGINFSNEQNLESIFCSTMTKAITKLSKQQDIYEAETTVGSLINWEAFEKTSSEEIRQSARLISIICKFLSLEESTSLICATNLDKTIDVSSRMKIPVCMAFKFPKPEKSHFTALRISTSKSYHEIQLCQDSCLSLCGCGGQKKRKTCKFLCRNVPACLEWFMCRKACESQDTCSSAWCSKKQCQGRCLEYLKRISFVVEEISIGAEESNFEMEIEESNFKDILGIKSPLKLKLHPRTIKIPVCGSVTVSKNLDISQLTKLEVTISDKRISRSMRNWIYYVAVQRPGSFEFVLSGSIGNRKFETELIEAAKACHSITIHDYATGIPKSLLRKISYEICDKKDL